MKAKHIFSFLGGVCDITICHQKCAVSLAVHLNNYIGNFAYFRVKYNSIFSLLVQSVSRVVLSSALFTKKDEFLVDWIVAFFQDFPWKSKPL
jgi:hypothetical protein